VRWSLWAYNESLYPSRVGASPKSKISDSEDPLLAGEDVNPNELKEGLLSLRNT